MEHLKYEKGRLKEKLKQINILNELYDRKAPKEVIEDVLFGMEEVKDNTEIGSRVIVDSLKERHDELTRQIENLNMQ